MRHGQTCLVVMTALTLAGCTGVQSVLAPEGPVGARISVLGWVMFAAGAAIFVIVLIATWAAIFGSDALRRSLGQQSVVVGGGIVFPVTVLSGLLLYGVWLTGEAAPGATKGAPTRIEVVGLQWWWRVSYLGSDGSRIVSANEIRIPVGQTVELLLKSADVIHSFWVPKLGGKVDMIPGRTTRLVVAADRAGTFRGQCAEYCGGPHALMALNVVALPSADFQQWIAALSAPAAEPKDAEAKRGKELFVAAGCGGCHTIRGTVANGVIGPDLTHVASRTSLGAATLPNTRASLARWIEDNQSVKPGNHMPVFRIFDESERDALSSYLASLR